MKASPVEVHGIHVNYVHVNYVSQKRYTPRTVAKKLLIRNPVLGIILIIHFSWETLVPGFRDLDIRILDFDVQIRELNSDQKNQPKSGLTIDTSSTLMKAGPVEVHGIRVNYVFQKQ